MEATLPPATKVAGFRIVHSMKLLLCLCLFTTSVLAAPTCPLCEKHRAYNKEHPGEYEFYEDYLEAQKKKEREEKSSE